MKKIEYTINLSFSAKFFRKSNKKKSIFKSLLKNNDKKGQINPMPKISKKGIISTEKVINIIFFLKLKRKNWDNFLILKKLVFI